MGNIRVVAGAVCRLPRDAWAESYATRLAHCKGLRQDETPLVGTKGTTRADSTGRLVPQDEEPGRATLNDPVVRLGEFATDAVQGVAGMSHPCTDGVIGARHHQGAPFEGQRLQDHTRMLTCVVQEVR